MVPGSELSRRTLVDIVGGGGLLGAGGQESCVEDGCCANNPSGAEFWETPDESWLRGIMWSCPVGPSHFKLTCFLRPGRCPRLGFP